MSKLFFLDAGPFLFGQNTQLLFEWLSMEKDAYRPQNSTVMASTSSGLLLTNQTLITLGLDIIFFCL